MLKEYKTVSEIAGPLMMVEGVADAKYGHIVDIELADGSMRHGQILQIEGDKVLVQVFEGTEGINVDGTTVRFLGKPMELAVSPGHPRPRLHRNGRAQRQRPRDSAEDETEYQRKSH